MRVLAGLYAPNSGTMAVEGRDVTGWSTADAIAAGVGMVHQHFMLVPTLTVAENVVLGPELTRGPVLDRAAAEEAVRKLSARDGTRRPARREGRRALRRRGAARRDPQDALSRREDPHPRRADRGALAARGARALAGAAHAARRGQHGRPHHAQARRGDRRLGDDHRDARRRARSRAWRPPARRRSDRARDGRPRRRARARRGVRRQRRAAELGAVSALLEVRDLIVAGATRSAGRDGVRRSASRRARSSASPASRATARPS